MQEGKEQAYHDYYQNEPQITRRTRMKQDTPEPIEEQGNKNNK
jgi:hypothetical protein